MLYVILLLILAVLLFGSSAVLGAIGFVLGLIVAIIALVWLSMLLGITPVTMLVIGVVGLFGLCGLVLLVCKLIEPWETKRTVAKIEAQRRANATPQENSTDNRPVEMCEEKRNDFHAACYAKITWEQYYAKWGYQTLTDLLAADQNSNR